MRQWLESLKTNRHANVSRYALPSSLNYTSHRGLMRGRISVQDLPSQNYRIQWHAAKWPSALPAIIQDNSRRIAVKCLRLRLPNEKLVQGPSMTCQPLDTCLNWDPKLIPLQLICQLCILIIIPFAVYARPAAYATQLLQLICHRIESPSCLQGGGFRAS